jgi:hypothetical protein
MTARGARPAVNTDRKYEVLEDFTGAMFMAELDRRRESGEADLVRTRPAHDGLRQWTTHALAMYEKAFPENPLEPLIETARPWVYRYRPETGEKSQRTEMQITAWGRCLQSPDGSRRELRLPVNRLDGRLRDESYRAVAALVAAEGAPGPRPVYIRVVRFAMEDGQIDPIFDGTRQAALELHRTAGKPAIASLLDSREYRPGSACVKCRFAAVCPELRQLPGLLGLSDTSRPRRSWSATNGTSYEACAARDHIRRHHLPTAISIERSQSAERGRALHAFLKTAHSLRPFTPCSVSLPVEWVPDRFTLTEAERDLGALLLRRHAAVCPLWRAQTAESLKPEPRLVFHDTAADVIVIAEPDLLYLDHGSWVWREVKTAASDRRWWRDPVRKYPQLALAVLIITRGGLGESRTRPRIELEVLRPGGADLLTIDPFLPSVREAAEARILGLVREWHRDDTFAARTGSECLKCEVAQWCSACTGKAAL